MKIFRSAEVPFRPADSATFVGSALTRRLAADEQTVPVQVYEVQFADGGRTNWHTHSGPQWLLVTEGQIRVQRQGEEAHDLRPGDAVVFAAGERHWHGAAPGNRGVHLAVNVNVTTDWLEEVSEVDYIGASPQV